MCFVIEVENSTLEKSQEFSEYIFTEIVISIVIDWKNDSNYIIIG